MSSLPDAVYTAADKLGVIVYRARSDTVRRWNEDRGERELRKFCGFYWYLRARSGRQETPGYGPFMSEAAAYCDAIGQLEAQAQTNKHIASVLRANALMQPAGASHAAG